MTSCEPASGSPDKEVAIHMPVRRIVAVAVGLVAVTAAPAHAKSAIANPYDCKPDPTLTQPFAPFGDLGLYTPVANQGVEAGAASWTLDDGAAVVAGNEPWRVAGAGDSHALDLPAGSSAVTAPICIDQTYPHFRLFALNAGSAKRSLEVDVLYYDTKGRLRGTKPYGYEAATNVWAATPPIAIDVWDKSSATAAPVSFRFVPKGKDAHFVIDDVFVDPYARAR
jgi:hypothetical protein